MDLKAHPMQNPTIERAGMAAVRATSIRLTTYAIDLADAMLAGLPRGAEHVRGHQRRLRRFLSESGRGHVANVSDGRCSRARVA